MNNPHAFPKLPITRESNGEILYQSDGMTLHDYFAAKAMQALLSDNDWRQDMNFSDTAFAAYQQADAMLKARENK